MRIMAADAGDIVFLFGENAFPGSRAQIQEISVVRRVTTRAKGVMRVELDTRHMPIMVPVLYQIVSRVILICWQDPAHLRVALPTDALGDIDWNIFSLESLHVLSGGPMARFTADGQFAPAPTDIGFHGIRLGWIEAGVVTRTALHQFGWKVIPLADPVMKARPLDEAIHIDVGNSLSPSDRKENILPSPNRRRSTPWSGLRQGIACLLGFLCAQNGKTVAGLAPGIIDLSVAVFAFFGPYVVLWFR